MARILLIYSTTDGQTLKISERIKSVLETDGHDVVLTSIQAAADIHPGAFDRIMMGASIRYGFHGKPVTAFIKRHAAVLGRLPSAFFSVNLVARKPEKRQATTNPYVKRFLRRIPWKPGAVAVFPGRLDYPRYTPIDRWVIRLIMTLTGGPTDPGAVVEFTDWNEVEAFAREFAKP
ncbi:MAG: menaquinone-dependent protoporphyrinogen IX dehydrogenase [Methylococcus sp.]